MDNPTLEQVCAQRRLWPCEKPMLEQASGRICDPMKRGIHTGAGNEHKKSLPWGGRNSSDNMWCTGCNPNSQSPDVACRSHRKREGSWVWEEERSVRKVVLDLIFIYYYPTLIWLVVNWINSSLTEPFFPVKHLWAGNWSHTCHLAPGTSSRTWVFRVAGTRLAACKNLSSNAFFTASEIFNTISFLCYSVEILISRNIAGWSNSDAPVAFLDDMSAGMHLSPTCLWHNHP